MMAAVTLSSERLTLRCPQETDFEAVSAFMGSERTGYIGGPQETEFERWRGFLGTIGHWGLRGYGFFTVLRGTEIVGRVGLVNHIMWDEPELGWQLFDGQEGRGYATEAARTVRRWAREALGLGPLISYIHPENTASRRLAARLGAKVERMTTLLGAPAEVWRHPEGKA